MSRFKLTGKDGEEFEINNIDLDEMPDFLKNHLCQESRKPDSSRPDSAKDRVLDPGWTREYLGQMLTDRDLDDEEDSRVARFDSTLHKFHRGELSDDNDPFAFLDDLDFEDPQ